MTIIHAPAAGQVVAVEEVDGLEVGAVDGPAVAIVAPEESSDPDVVVVAPVAGSIVEISDRQFVLAPAEESPPVPSCRLVRVSVLGNVGSKVEPGADPDDDVEAGQELLRWRRRRDDAEVSFLVELVDPDGEVLCETINAEVYAAEAIMEIMGPLGEELSPVVALADDGSVTPADPQQASDLTQQGRAPGQLGDPADPADPDGARG